MASIREAEVSISVCMLEFKFMFFTVMTRIPKMRPHHLSVVLQTARRVRYLAKPGLGILLLHFLQSRALFWACFWDYCTFTAAGWAVPSW